MRSASTLDVSLSRVFNQLFLFYSWHALPLILSVPRMPTLWNIPLVMSIPSSFLRLLKSFSLICYVIARTEWSSCNTRMSSPYTFCCCLFDFLDNILLFGNYFVFDVCVEMFHFISVHGLSLQVTMEKRFTCEKRSEMCICFGSLIVLMWPYVVDRTKKYNYELTTHTTKKQN